MMCTQHHARPRSHSHHCRSLHALPRHLALTPSWLVSLFFEIACNVDECTDSTAHPEPWLLGPGLEVVESLSHEYMHTYTPITPNTHTVMRVHTQHTHTHTLISLSVTHTLSLCLSLSLCASLCLSPSGSQEPAAVSVTGSVLSFITVVCSVSLSLTLSVCLSLSLP
jgi:hypothetical protein